MHLSIRNCEKYWLMSKMLTKRKNIYQYLKHKRDLFTLVHPSMTKQFRKRHNKFFLSNTYLTKIESYSLYQKKCPHLCTLESIINKVVQNY